MNVWDNLRNIGQYVRTRWPSSNPDSYYRYKAGRERERKQVEHTRQDAERVGERERQRAERGREHEQRYATERGAEEPRTEAPHRDTSQPE